MKKLISPGVSLIVYTRNTTPVSRSTVAFPLVFNAITEFPGTVQLQTNATLQNGVNYNYVYQTKYPSLSLDAFYLVDRLNKVGLYTRQQPRGGWLFNRSIRGQGATKYPV